jgi:microcystin-dependent protein
MAEPFIGQIEIFAFGFAPKGWAQCNGQLLAINQNQALFSLLGTTFGGDGRQTFALPDLRARVPMGQGAGPGLTPRQMGEKDGAEAHTLTIAETPSHTHAINTISNPTLSNNVDTPKNTVALAKTTGTNKDGGTITVDIYAPDAAPNQQMAPAALGNTGGQPHSNMMPYLGTNICIALRGLFPSRN